MVTIRHIDEINEIIAANSMTLLYVSSKTCGVCEVIFPRIESMLKQFPKMKAVKAELDELPGISGGFQIFTIPCVLGFVEGKEIIREARYINLQGIEEQIRRYYDMLFELSE